MGIRKYFYEARYDEVSGFLGLGNKPFEEWDDLYVPDVMLPTSAIEKLASRTLTDSGAVPELGDEARISLFLSGANITTSLAENEASQGTFFRRFRPWLAFSGVFYDPRCATPCQRVVSAAGRLRGRFSAAMICFPLCVCARQLNFWTISREYCASCSVRSYLLIEMGGHSLNF
jgi:hypothetical protein